MQHTFFYRYGTIMRQVLQTPNIEWCEVMRASALNPLYAEIMKIVKRTDSKLVHECPYNEFIMENKIPDLTSLPSIFSDGYYKFLVNATDSENKMIFSIESIIEWISSEKNSFG